MPYLNLDLDYFTHPKIMKLAKILGSHSVVYPMKLWCYAGKHFPVTGMLEGCSKHDIEEAVGWDGEPGKLVDTLVKISLLDMKKSETESENSSFKIHDWKHHAGHLWAFKKRAKTAAKKRWKDYASSIATSNAKGCAPNLTYPNLTSSSSLHLKKDSEKKKLKSVATLSRAEKLERLETFSVSDELRAWAQSEFGVQIPADIESEFKSFWRDQKNLRSDWPSTFRSRVRQLVSLGILKPKATNVWGD